MLDQFYDPKWLVKITARDQSFASSLEREEFGLPTLRLLQILFGQVVLHSES